jgi:pyruvate, water dikinase
MRDKGNPEKEARNDHWQWRRRAVEKLADALDPVRFGVKALYLFGSTKNATAGPESDIDLLIHFAGSEGQRRDLLLWLEGWSLCLSHINFEKTGHKTGGLLDAHLITDADIQNRTSYAVKIGAVTDAASILMLKGGLKNHPPDPKTGSKAGL